jgi:hypothetical protein
MSRATSSYGIGGSGSNSPLQLGLDRSYVETDDPVLKVIQDYARKEAGLGSAPISNTLDLSAFETPPAAPRQWTPPAPWNANMGGGYQGYNPGRTVGDIARLAQGGGGGGGFGSMPISGEGALWPTRPGFAQSNGWGRGQTGNPQLDVLIGNQGGF